MTHWIKMRKDLRGDPAVLLLSTLLGLKPREIVGVLHEFWSWADTNLVDGTARGLTAQHVDELVGVAGFSAAMITAGWLTLDDDGLHIPNFERHLGDGAKRRAQNSSRALKCRFRKDAAAARVGEPRQHDLIDQIARHLNLGYPKAGRVVGEIGVTPADWHAWLAYERELGTPLTVQNIQRFRRPADIPPPVPRPRTEIPAEQLSRRSSFNRLELLGPDRRLRRPGATSR